MEISKKKWREERGKRVECTTQKTDRLKERQNGANTIRELMRIEQ